MDHRLEGRRVLVTQSPDYMGPAIVEFFREQDAEVIADEQILRALESAETLIQKTGSIDILVANLAADVHFGTTATRESALLALFLASSESDFFVGQSFPFSGG